ncbi:hypothetical protein BT96DRAFT_984569 [Gymnopus androsaceus JB14]|uniref:Uncharacterized protein n=1 Tax=Gymnopus androsaceus JB14 TaxID=1447944 RepID=A0A6A4IFW4_9AGAR|nr:hypothetical protein BT96DRAFT_984569 [Gymnopus androsaceus JB14]
MSESNHVQNPTETEKELERRRWAKMWEDCEAPETMGETIYADFSHLYRQIDNFNSNIAYGCTIGKGWKSFIRKLCIQLVELDAGVEFSQIKEKFGKLVIYFRFVITSTGQEPTQWQKDQYRKSTND